MKYCRHLEHLEEVLYECPGELIAELGESIGDYLESICTKDVVNVEDLRQRLRAWSETAYAVEPLVEVLHEVGEVAERQHLEDVRRDKIEQVILKPKPLQREIEARHARRLIDRLATARASGDIDAAAQARDHLERYAAEGCTSLIRELCLSEMRLDGLMYGETPSANESGQLGSRRAELLQ